MLMRERSASSYIQRALTLSPVEVQAHHWCAAVVHELAPPFPTATPTGLRLMGICPTVTVSAGT